MIAEITKQLAERTVKDTDDAIVFAISKFLGRDDWSLLDIAQRGVFKRYRDGIEIFAFDGHDLIEFHPLQSTWEVVDGVQKIKVTKPYRFLFSPESDSKNLPSLPK